MEKKKSYGVLIAGAILLILGIVLAVITHNNSYQESVAYGSQLSDVKAQLEDRKSTRLNSSHYQQSRMPSSA